MVPVARDARPDLERQVSKTSGTPMATPTQAMEETSWSDTSTPSTFTSWSSVVWTSTVVVSSPDTSSIWSGTSITASPTTTFKELAVPAPVSSTVASDQVKDDDNQRASSTPAYTSTRQTTLTAPSSTLVIDAGLANEGTTLLDATPASTSTAPIPTFALGHGPRPGIIVGATVGSVAAVTLIALAFIWHARRMAWCCVRAGSRAHTPEERFEPAEAHALQRRGSSRSAIPHYRRSAEHSRSLLALDDPDQGQGHDPNRPRTPSNPYLSADASGSGPRAPSPWDIPRKGEFIEGPSSTASSNGGRHTPTGNGVNISSTGSHDHPHSAFLSVPIPVDSDMPRMPSPSPPSTPSSYRTTPSVPWAIDLAGRASPKTSVGHSSPMTGSVAVAAPAHPLGSSTGHDSPILLATGATPTLPLIASVSPLPSLGHGSPPPSRTVSPRASASPLATQQAGLGQEAVQGHQTAQGQPAVQQAPPGQTSASSTSTDALPPSSSVSASLSRQLPAIPFERPAYMTTTQRLGSRPQSLHEKASEMGVGGLDELGVAMGLGDALNLPEARSVRQATAPTPRRGSVAEGTQVPPVTSLPSTPRRGSASSNIMPGVSTKLLSPATPTRPALHRSSPASSLSPEARPNTPLRHDLATSPLAPHALDERRGSTTSLTRQAVSPSTSQTPAPGMPWAAKRQ